MNETIFKIFIFNTLVQLVFLYLQDRPASFEKSEDTEVETPLIRKITKHEISANIFLFSE